MKSQSIMQPLVSEAKPFSEADEVSHDISPTGSNNADERDCKPEESTSSATKQDSSLKASRVPISPGYCPCPSISDHWTLADFDIAK